MMIECDERILLWIQENLRFDFLTPIMKFITHLGDAGIIWIILSIVLLFFNKTRKAGIYSISALIIMLLFNNMFLKEVINRTRPYEVIEGLKLLIPKQPDPSFPSGHSAASFASTTAIYRHIPQKAGIPLLILAFLISFSRLYVGIHYPTDVIGGIIIGVIIGIIVNIIGDKIYDIKKKTHE